MIIHILQHQRDENEAYIKIWAKRKGILITRTLLYKDQHFPAFQHFDVLIIMGGSMNVHEVNKYPFLANEKTFIAGAIDSGKKIIGICLGAQLLAAALGGKVSKNPQKEIGWFPVTLTGEGMKSMIFDSLPSSFMTFHWHEDTFSIPQGAKRLAESNACANQAFSLGDDFLGLQFHPEITWKSLAGMEGASGSEPIKGKFVQTSKEIMKGKEFIGKNNIVMERILENFLESGF